MAHLARFIVCSLLMVPAIHQSADADIVKYLDKDGTWHFTDTYIHNRQKAYIKTVKKKSKAKSYSSKPLLKQFYRKDILDASQNYGVDPRLIQSVIQVESDYNPLAISPAGAQGLMQLMPDTAKKYGVSNAFAPRENIYGGTNYLSYLLKRYGGNIKLALAAYNAGETAVERYGGIPPFAETEKYVERVVLLYTGKKPLITKTRRVKRKAKKTKIYRYYDKDGNILFTDKPNKNLKKAKRAY